MKRKIAMRFSIRQKPDKFRQKLPAIPGQAGQVPSKAGQSTSKTYPLFVSVAFFVVIKY
jgi:hypothetical protein